MRYLSILLLCAPAVAQSGTHQIALNYNYNGIVHLGEDGDPDNPDGYRSIGDRGLNFTGGAPSNPTIDKYNLVTNAGALDIVHLGCRPCTGWNGYDGSANGDCRGTQPNWLTNPDHGGAETTMFATPIVLSDESQISCIFQVTDGGGNFSVTAHTNIGDIPLGSMGAGDWFGGPYAGTDNFDCAGLAGAGLHIDEGILSDGGALAGVTANGLSFQRENPNAQYAIFACNVTTGIAPPPPETRDAITLNYNWNGIVHYGEPGNADAPMGYRSIGDRGLDFTNGAPSDDLTDKYFFVQQPNALDIVHLGPRNFDDDPGSCWGNRPVWLDANWDHGGQSAASDAACTTVLHRPMTITDSSRIDLIFNISDGGGNFDVQCDFDSGASTTGSVGAGDWWNGPFPGTGNFDCVNLPDWGLHINEGSVDLSAFAGEVLTSITFRNQNNGNAGHAIFAANAINVDVAPLNVDAVALDYNWNGIVHAGEAGSPDADMGYRSISDRGLDFSNGSPSDKKCAKYTFETAADAMDIVHLGDRGFDDDTGNCWGDQPDWLPSGWGHLVAPQETTIDGGMIIGPESRLELVFQISNGGGSFDLNVDCESGAWTVATLGGNDWWNGPYPGTGNTDCAGPDTSLHIVEATVDLRALAGEVITSISFEEQSNLNAGYAILAMNMVGMDAVVVCPDNAFCFGDGSGADCPCLNFGGPCHGCANGADAEGGYLETQGTASLTNDTVVLHAKDLVPNMPCLFFSGSNAINGGLGIPFGDGLRCVGNEAVRVEVSAVNNIGEATTTVEVSTHGQAYGHTIDPGETVLYQLWYREGTSSNCGNSHNLTNAVSLQWAL